jgi:hypothetical protein
MSFQSVRTTESLACRQNEAILHLVRALEPWNVPHGSELKEVAAGSSSYTRPFRQAEEKRSGDKNVERQMRSFRDTRISCSVDLHRSTVAQRGRAIAQLGRASKTEDGNHSRKLYFTTHARSRLLLSPSS